MLIKSKRHTARDLEVWASTMRTAEIHAQLKSFQRVAKQASDALLTFTGTGRGYAGVSWGKDSAVVAHLVATLRPEWPLVWVRVEPIVNPDCDLVRDAFLDAFPGARYDEIVVRCRRDSDGWHASGTLEHGFSIAAKRYGERYITGIRAEESGIRKLRVATHGLASKNTCAPIGRWSSWDVFAYMQSRGVPIHPAYACTMNGAFEPGRIRVSSLGGKRGTGMGRAEWEQRYYGQELLQIDRLSS